MKYLFSLFLFLIAIKGLSQIPKPLPNTYINDLAGVLSQDQVKAVNDSVREIETRSSVQVAIILINKLPANTSIEDYALQVGRQWHVGNANNGLVYVAVIDEHKQRLEVATNLQGDITDLHARLITDNIKPYFRQKDYFGGINELLNGIKQRVDPVIKEQLRLAQIEQDKKSENRKDNAVKFLLWFLIVSLPVIPIAIYFIKKRKRKILEQQKNVIITGKVLREQMLGRMERKGYDKPVLEKKIDIDYIPPVPSYKSNDSDNDDDSPAKSDNDDDGNWGKGSSGNDSSSGFTGGGASNDW